VALLFSLYIYERQTFLNVNLHLKRDNVGNFHQCVYCLCTIYVCDDDDDDDDVDDDAICRKAIHTI
jgi:hypothetical protein